MAETTSAPSSRVKSRLTGVPETMLLTLSARAADAAEPSPVLGDVWAAKTLEQIESRTSHKRRTVSDGAFAAAVVPRALVLDTWTVEFLQAHSEATVLHLACGLDSRALRLSWGRGVRWIDVDMPEVIEIRKQVLPNPSGDYTLVASSVTETAWLERIPADRPTIVIMEGLLAYLKPEDIQQLAQKICSRFSGGQIIFDTIGNTCKLIYTYGAMFKSLVGPVKNTGAVYQFAMDAPDTFTRLQPGLRPRDVVRFHEHPGFWIIAPRLTRWQAWILTWFPGFSSYVSFWRYDY
ncbi:S-adenosyl-L-methionine-dependent methyltransferase [Thozetella sp. PMI_491]|nr:S-adenosyl-L-methionine-dependent methyltransferase [Thozetella sp. PMI_491]